MTNKKIALIGAASGWGAKIRTNEGGPTAMRAFRLAEKLAQHNLQVAWDEIIFAKERGSLNTSMDPTFTLPHILDHAERLAQRIIYNMEAGSFPVVIGGDQSTAVGIWSGVITALKRPQNFGLLWLDAHMDAHTHETTESNAVHGMPLACLLGYGASELVNLAQKGPKLNPEHLVLVGVRSYERGEADLLKRLGVRIFFMDEVKQKGIDVVLQEAHATITQKTDIFGISVDLDAFDPVDAPGVGSPEKDGLRVQETLPALAKLADDPGFAGLEISEYNPHLDQNFQTAQIVLDLCLSLL
ncbi:MAG: arginase [Pseudomonadota bacterium]